jgi:hypothetical protein
LLGGADGFDAQPHGFIYGKHIVVFVFAQQAVIDEYAGLLLAYCPVDQSGGNR